MSRGTRGRGTSEAGFTLVEVLVVLTLFSVIGGIVTAGVVSALRSAAQTNAKIEALNELEIASQRVTRDLRAAEGIVISSGDPEREITTLLRSEAGNIEAVSYIVQDGELIRVDTGQTLVTAVGNAATEPVFVYLDRRGDPLPSCTDAGCEGLAQVGLRLVRDVEDLNPVIVETRTSVRNVRYGSIS